MTFNSLPPRRMEGFQAAVPCYELVEISGLTRWRARSTKGISAFVGRAEERPCLSAPLGKLARPAGDGVGGNGRRRQVARGA